MLLDYSIEKSVTMVIFWFDYIMLFDKRDILKIEAVGTPKVV